MQLPELEKKILDYIKTAYNAEYAGLLEVTKEDTIYTLKIGIPSYMSPTTITIDTDSEDSFLEYIYSELKSRNYMRLEIYKIVRTNESND